MTGVALGFDARQPARGLRPRTSPPWASLPIVRPCDYATLPEAEVSGIDIVVETVTARPGAEAEVVREMEALSCPGGNQTSKSSRLPDQRDRQRPQDAGPHDGPALFMPAHLIPLVESCVRHSEGSRPNGGRDHVVDRQAASPGKKDVIAPGNRTRAPDAQGLVADRGRRRLAGGYRRHGAAIFGFRYAARRPIVQKEHSGWGTTWRWPRSFWPDLSTARVAPVLQRNVDEGRNRFKTKRGYSEWNDDLHAKEAPRLSALFASVWKSSRGRGDSLVDAPRRRGAATGPPPASGDHSIGPLPPPLPRGTADGGGHPADAREGRWLRGAL